MLGGALRVSWRHEVQGCTGGRASPAKTPGTPRNPRPGTLWHVQALSTWTPLVPNTPGLQAHHHERDRGTQHTVRLEL